MIAARERIPVLPIPLPLVWTTPLKAMPPQKGPALMRKKHFSFEQVFEYIWQHCDSEGLWGGDDDSLVEEFNVSEDEAHTMLGDLSDRGLIEKLYPGKYAIVRWREPDDPGEHLQWWEIYH